MDEEKKKKISTGREKLEAYKKKKHAKEKSNSEASSNSESSPSLSPMLLPENKVQENEPLSDTSSISEHLLSSNDSVENDRSFQEIEVLNVPSNFSMILANIHPDEIDNISQENKPLSLSTPSLLSDHFNVLNLNRSLNPEASNNVQSILEEILNKKVFHPSLQDRDVSITSNVSSLNIFEGINLDDKSISNYVSRLKPNEHVGDILSDIRESNFHNQDDNPDKNKQYEELLSTKDLTITALNAELDSLREMASNTSTMSLNTTTTEYKQFQEEYRIKFVEFENAIVDRNNVIEKLTRSLEESAAYRNELEKKTEALAQELLLLQEQCTEARNHIKQLNSNKSVKLDQNENDDINPDIDITKTSQVISFDDSPNLEKEFSSFEQALNPNQARKMNDLKIRIQLYIDQKLLQCKANQELELKVLKEQLENEKNDYDTEITRLQQLLLGVKCGSTELLDLKQELESKHAKEMEELRTYFEQKCSDLEKHYSEEVFSQQSRKMSGSSSISDAELASDLLFTSSHPQPGPGGDNSMHVQDIPVKIDESNADLAEVKNQLHDLQLFLSKFDVEKLSRDEVTEIQADLSKRHLQTLLKCDLNSLKAEMQNKYHAELEILREDYENKIDLLNIEHEKKHHHLERRYEEKIENLQYELDEALKNVAISVSNAVQEVASSGEYELAEVVQSYERRLQEQVTSAKFDLMDALENQIQMLVSNPHVDDAHLPSELVQLRNKFAQKYDAEMADLKKQHEQEISALKEDHLRKLNNAVDRARRRSIKESENTSLEPEQQQQQEEDAVKERNRLRKTTAALRNLLRELLKYFTQCEDELNNTLFDELLKHYETNLTDSLNESSKHVHFTPDFSDFLNIVDNTSSLDSRDLSIDLKNELGACLDRLKADANAVLALTSNSPTKLSEEVGDVKPLEEKINLLVRQLKAELQTKSDLNDELHDLRSYVKSLEVERGSLVGEVDQLVGKQKVLETELGRAKEKISDLIECGHKEIVSEGYGENKSFTSRSLSNKRATLNELQDRARTLVADCNIKADNSLYQLIDDLCREADLILDESKKEKEDLQLQIDAADKKLRATCEFLEVQATEREQERDEAQKEIETLQEQLRDREKDRASCERIAKEVELLEAQMRDMTKLMEESDRKQQEVETERKEAVEKIYVLRQIIRDLEAQVETKLQNESQLKNVIEDLEKLINQQTRLNDELTQELTAVKTGPDAQQCHEIITRLEEELQKFRLNSELTGNEGVLKHIKIQLFEIETSIDGRTRDLEALHSAIASTTCSSPTEDMSIKDQIRPQTPSSILDECDVPLQQLARLKEKLVKHTRAEEAAVKRIRDLEMQLVSSKHEFEEVQADKDMLQEKISDQLGIIASLQMRLDEQRLRADNVSKQTNTSLEIRIYDLETELQNLTEKLGNRDKTIKQLNNAIDETRKRLQEREMELVAMANDRNLLDLENENEQLKVENQSLIDKINVDVQNAQILPNLVDNILADKNADIDKLRDELNETRKQMEFYTTLNFNQEQLNTLSQLRSSGHAFTDFLTMFDITDGEQARKVEAPPVELFSPIPEFKRSANETTILSDPFKESRFPAELSSIELAHPKQLNYTATAPEGRQAKPNSTEIFKSAEKKVHFKDVENNAFQRSSSNNNNIAELQNKISALENELSAKDVVIAEYNERLMLLMELELKYETLQKHLEETENVLKQTTETFEKEQNALKDVEQNLRIELAEKKMHLDKKDEELGLEKQDSARKYQMYVDLVKEKRELDHQLKDIQENNKAAKELQDELQKTALKVQKTEAELVQKSEILETTQKKLNEFQAELNEKSRMLEQFTADMHTKSAELKERDDENGKLLKELKNKSSQMNSLNEAIEKLNAEVRVKNEEIQKLSDDIEATKRESLKDYDTKIKQLQNLLVDRDCEIEILNEDLNRYQNEIGNVEAKLSAESNFKANEMQLQLIRNKKELAAKDLEIVKLKTDNDNLSKEVTHLKEFLNEKDKVIEQIKADSQSLQLSLETIQNKMRESGNIIDLKNRLQEQTLINNQLHDEITNLKTAIGQNDAKVDMCASMEIEEITGQVREQLNYSAHLDSNILNAINSGSEMDQNSDDLEYLRRAYRKERAVNKQLMQRKVDLQKEMQQFEIRLQKENEKVIELEILLENEKRSSQAIQLEDANLIQQMRLRLETVMETENELQNALESEKQVTATLRAQLNALKTGSSSSSNSKTEATEYKSLPNMVVIEMENLRKELQSVKEDNSKLKRDIKALKHSKYESEANTKYLNDLLKLRASEITTLEARIDSNKEQENAVKEKLIEARTELDQRNREVENSRALMEELEEEKGELKKQIARLHEKIKELQEDKQMNDVLSQENDANLHSTVPEKFVKKIKELSHVVKDHVRDNKLMTETLAKINEERCALQERIQMLEAQNNIKMPFDDPAARAHHLFGKYLRSESYRKALVYQKNYLLALLATYQDFRPITNRLPLSNFQSRHSKANRSSGAERFKSVAYALIALARMRYLVQRWHTGKRIGAVTYRHQARQNPHPQTAFHLGQPVSSQNFANPLFRNTRLHRPLGTDEALLTNNANPVDNADMFAETAASQAMPGNSRHLRSAFEEGPMTPPRSHELPPWSGATPPSKDRSLRGSSRELPITPRADQSCSRDNLSTLTAPELLSQYVERFNQIQHRLGIVLESTNSA